ncbi:DUF2158 domain-containing protein [Azospirillum sp. YIM DDC1]|uniref:DUF2158 domain-containing protein n=1 Tax=Azospirillum aestuarii TaxID=2802052 RepID=A0ABS1I8M5_9PROT|nr:DUF2158 domain-containing protein [Azospirillum aestuarii]MBK4723410.1 DUF2158 domain-containing protein [Azospirillum aestuarii]
MSSGEKFPIGKLVRLKSGGPDMTVKSKTDSSGYLYTQWFAGKKLEQGHFQVDSLEEVKPKPEAE